jgi:hypothetical protein
MSKIYPFGIPLSLSVDESSGSEQHNESLEKDNKIYFKKSSKWKIADFYGMYLFVVILFCISIYEFYKVINLHLGGLNNDIAVAIGCFCVSIMIMIIQSDTPYPNPFEITNTGFIYPFKRSLKIRFVNYNDIKEVVFTNFGLNCLILLQNGKIIGIREGQDPQGYYILSDILIKKSPPTIIPDFSMMKKYNNINNKKERLNVLRQLMEKNKDLPPPPQEWLLKL